MAGILCEQCGYMNPEGSKECEICAEPLTQGAPTPAPAPVEESAPAAVAPVAAPSVEAVVSSCSNQVQTAQQNVTPSSNPDVEYFVMCPESSTKTVVSGPNVTTYFCEGCKTEHFIDGMIWFVESRNLANATAQQINQPVSQPIAPKGDNLWLEEVNSHFRIDITKPGGTLGRYGTFGGEYFLSRGMNTVSGDHVKFNYEFNNWTVTHISKTNPTTYDGMIMASNEPTLLEDGKILKLANAVSFVVRIG